MVTSTSDGSINLYIDKDDNTMGDGNYAYSYTGISIKCVNSKDEATTPNFNIRQNRNPCLDSVKQWKGIGQNRPAARTGSNTLPFILAVKDEESKLVTKQYYEVGTLEKTYVRNGQWPF